MSLRPSNRAEAGGCRGRHVAGRSSSFLLHARFLLNAANARWNLRDLDRAPKLDAMRTTEPCHSDDRMRTADESAFKHNPEIRMLAIYLLLGDLPAPTRHLDGDCSDMTVQVTITATGRRSLPADVCRCPGSIAGGPISIDQTADGVVLRTAAQAVAGAQELAQRDTADKPEASVDAFLARR